MPTLQIPEKFQPFVEPHRYKIAYGGRGGAKSWSIADILIAMSTDRPLRVLCTREIQSSIKQSVHKLLSDRIAATGQAAKFTILRDSITTINGSEFIFEGLRYNIDKIKSLEAVDICWVEEANVVSEGSWKVLIPTIRKDKSEIWVSFNPGLDTDAAWIRFVKNSPPDSVVINVNWRENPWTTDVMVQEIEYQMELDYDDYMHIYEGELREYAEGAIYAQQLRSVRKDGRLCTIPVEPVETHTFWDLGLDDATTIWWMQKIGPQHRFVHYFEDNFKHIGDYCQVIKEVGEKRDLIYGTHYMPHDVEQKILGMPRTRLEQFKDGGVKPIKVVPRVHSLQEGIQQTKRAFASCWFDEEYCADGWKALANYRRSLNEVTNKYSDTPVHDWACHGADGFRQFAQGFKGASVWTRGADTEMSERRRKSIARNRREHRERSRSGRHSRPRY